jgi:hypothetical protein
VISAVVGAVGVGLVADWNPIKWNVSLRVYLAQAFQINRDSIALLKSS